MGQQPHGPAGEHRPAQHAELRRPRRRRRSTPCAAVGRCSPGQRAEGFFVDLGSIFDLGTLRPFQHLHLIPSADAMGVNGSQAVQRPHDRDPGAQGRPRQGRRSRSATRWTRTPSSVCTRRRAGAAVHVLDDQRRARTTARSCRCRGWPTRCSTRSSSRWRCKDRVEPHDARARTATSRSTSRVPSWPGCCPSCTRACSRTSRRTTRTAPTCSRSC